MSIGMPWPRAHLIPICVQRAPNNSRLCQVGEVSPRSPGSARRTRGRARPQRPWISTLREAEGVWGHSHKHSNKKLNIHMISIFQSVSELARLALKGLNNSAQGQSRASRDATLGVGFHNFFLCTLKELHKIRIGKCNCEYGTISMSHFQGNVLGAPKPRVARPLKYPGLGYAAPLGIEITGNDHALLI